MVDYYFNFKQTEHGLEPHIIGSMSLQQPGLGNRELELALWRRMYSDGLNGTDETSQAPKHKKFELFDIQDTGYKIGIEKTMDGIPCRRLTLVNPDGIIVMYYSLSPKNNYGVLQTRDIGSIQRERRVAPDVVYPRMVNEAIRKANSASYQPPRLQQMQSKSSAQTGYPP